MSSFRMLSSPLPRQQECSGPDAAPGRFGCVLLRAVMAGIAGCDRPTLPYDPGVEVGAVGHGAGGEDTVVPVDAVAYACQFPATDIASQFLRRRLSAGPRLPFSQGQVLDIGAERVAGRRLDGVDALVERLRHHVAGIVDEVGVVAEAADERVGAGAA